MTANAFNAAANTSQPYVFDLKREVAAFYHDHPEQRKKIFFIDAATPSGALYRGDETDVREICAQLDKNSHLSTKIAEAHKTGRAGAVRYGEEGEEEGYACILLVTPRSLKNINPLGHAVPPDVVDAFSFDHEAGHLLCPGGYENKSPRMKEYIADAYAVIRHFQRFGANEDCIKNLAAMRTIEMILGRDDSHFTAPIVEKIIADSRKMNNFSGLTREETMAEAVRYAEKNAMDAQLVSYMAKNFGDHLDTAALLRGDFTRLGNLGAFLLKTQIPEEFKWGAIAVRTLLDGNIGIDGTRLPPPHAPEWTHLRKALDARAAAFEQPQKSKLIAVSGELSF